MGVVIVSHFNSFLQGGASTAAQHLHLALLRNGINSRFQYKRGQRFLDPESDDPTGQAFHVTQWSGRDSLTGVINRLKYRIHRQQFKRATRDAKTGSEIFTSAKGDAYTPWPPLNHPAADHLVAQRSQQIIHLHWIAKFIDYQSFFGSLPADQPIVWTLHDMAALTGGCHFSGECQRFRSGCGQCPQLARPSDKDASALTYTAKAAALRGLSNLHIVAPSEWLIGLARLSPLLSNACSFQRIPYGIPTKKLYPVDAALARSMLRVDTDEFLIAFGAMNLANRRKGAAELIDALHAVAGTMKLRCLIFGSGTLDGSTERLPPTVNVGRIRDDHMRRLVYSAADAFVLPSTQDNLPLTGLESMACGTPIIGFDAGGIPDYVIPEKTGLLVETGNSKEMAAALRWAAANRSTMSAMGSRARSMVLGEFDSDVQAQRYIELYQNMIAENKNRIQQGSVDRIDRAA